MIRGLVKYASVCKNTAACNTVEGVWNALILFSNSLKALSSCSHLHPKADIGQPV